jgi:uroporphyrin-III C-methyltransferase/precorrin-2 dehydrogenase/sirohydrochlorin ferrochelatase
MAVQQFPTVMHQLTTHGRPADTPVAIIERGTTEQQRVIRGTLGQLNILAKAHKVQAPAMLIVGKVAAMGKESALFGRVQVGQDSGFEIEKSATQSTANN